MQLKKRKRSNSDSEDVDDKLVGDKGLKIPKPEGVEDSDRSRESKAAKSGRKRS